MRKVGTSLGWGLLSFILAWGCGSDGTDPPHGGDPPGTDDPHEVTGPEIRGVLGEIVWSEGSCLAGGRCSRTATVDVPLDWSDESSRRISLKVHHWETREQRKGQVWTLQGGPGRGATDGEPERIDLFLRGGYDVLAVDYRGVGGSTLLGCDPARAHSLNPICIAQLKEEWGEGLRQFSSSATAIDIGMLIEALRIPDEKVFVWAVSYGTSLANRYLTFFPEQVDGVILDSICAADGCKSIPLRDSYTTEFMKFVMEACKSDEFCSSKFTGDPWGFVTGLMSKIRSGHCDRALHPVYGHRSVSLLLPRLLERQTFMELGYATAYRLDRCAEQDIEPLRTIMRLFVPELPQASGAGAEFSAYLYATIVMSEFWPPGLTMDDLREDARTQVFDPGAVATMAGIQPILSWPLERPPEDLLQWARTSIPALLLNGTLDYATPVWDLEGIEDAFGGPNQHFVVVPFQGHDTLLGDFSMDPCITSLVLGFLDNPAGSPDRACVDERTFPDISGTGLLANWGFGTTDLWGDGAPAARSVAPPPPGAIEAWERARLRIIQRDGF